MHFEVFDLGLVDFRKAQELQKEILFKVKDGSLESGLIICQHYPIITLGRTADKKNILVGEQELNQRGIATYLAERAGDVTYHDPAQLTAYPVFNLDSLKKDIHLFLRQLEEVVILFLRDLGISGQRISGLTGVWVDKQKIASIGIAIKNWITFHGLSINVKKDGLKNFGLIRPCGMDIEMTSLETILAKDIAIDSLKHNLIHKFRDVFTLKATGRLPMPAKKICATNIGESAMFYGRSSKDVPNNRGG